ncbi:hypothetical protein ACJX0J_008239, partial [Zea mays]
FTTVKDYVNEFWDKSQKLRDAIQTLFSSKLNCFFFLKILHNKHYNDNSSCMDIGLRPIEEIGGAVGLLTSITFSKINGRVTILCIGYLYKSVSTLSNINMGFASTPHTIGFVDKNILGTIIRLGTTKS